MNHDKPWLDHYPKGMPTDIDPGRYESVMAVFDEACQRFADRPAYTSFGATITYRELDRQVSAFASALTHELGLAPGDRLAIMMPNLLQYPIVAFGALRAGLTVVNTNPLYSPRELKHQLVDSGAKAIVVVDAFAATVESVLDDTPLEHVVVTRIGDLLGFPKSLLINFVLKYVKRRVPNYSLPGAIRFDTLLKRGAEQPRVAVPLGHDDIAFLQYTGGTTGVAKGAVLTHRNMVANIVQAHTWITHDGLFEEGSEIIVTALPLYHIFSLTANCLVFMKLGALNVLITNPRDLPAFVKELGKHRFTAFTGVNTLFSALLNTDGFAALNFDDLKLTLGGGMAVQEVVAKRWKEVTGCNLVEAYGLTETSPAACINPIVPGDFNHSIGMPIPSTDASIRNDDNEPVPIGEVGELCLRGPQVMRGYWQRPEETDKAIDSEGWFHTGDLATLDERGYVRIVDRLKDMILVSGFNVYPNEVESVVAQMPGIVEAGVCGVPDEHSGETVKLVAVRKDESITEDAVHDWCREQLTGYKRPKIVHFVEELPKTNVGKVLRRELRDL